MIRKTLFLILALALSSVPVFLMAHAFTHFAQVDVLDTTETGNDSEADLDEICLDCLALTALNIILIAAGYVLGDSTSHRSLALVTIRHYADNASFYYSRAPPFPIL